MLFSRLVKLYISIHALRAEDDKRGRRFVRLQLSISIHALRAEGDIFHESQGEVAQISIHALRAEGDRSILPH